MPTTVLVADGEPSVLDAVEAALVEWGYDVICAHDGQEALSKAGAEHPDVVVLDAEVPGLGRWELMDRLKRARDTHGFFAIILSRKLVEYDWAAAQQAGWI